MPRVGDMMAVRQKVVLHREEAMDVSFEKVNVSAIIEETLSADAELREIWDASRMECKGQPAPKEEWSTRELCEPVKADYKIPQKQQYKP